MKKRALMVLFLLSALLTTSVVHAPAAVGFGFGGEQRSVRLSQKNLPRLDKGNYAAWARVNDKNILIGQFNVTDDGDIEDLTGKKTDTFKSGQNLANAEVIFVTIEGSKVNGRGPSKTRILEGKVERNSASLDFPVDYSRSSGVCVMAVMAAPIQESAVPLKNGVWFVRISGGKIEKGLNVPDAPAGWSYGGWFEKGDNQPLEMGKFKSPDQSDDFNNFSPSIPPPDFPGENFLQNAPSGYRFPLDVSGGTVWVTLEPNQDTGRSPFPMVLFKRDIPKDEEARRNITLDNMSEDFPTMKATMR